MTTVSRRAKEVKQPRGGYINPKKMRAIEFDDGRTLGDENISPITMGLVVDYLTRWKITGDIEKAFDISLLGASLVGHADEARMYLHEITDMGDRSIGNACKLTAFDQCYRAGIPYSMVDFDINPDAQTCENVRVMVDRCMGMFDEFGPVVEDGFQMDGGFTDIVTNGDGDYLTKDTVWDLKVSKYDPKPQHTLQVAMYYLIGKHSENRNFESIENIGIFNPRLNKVYLMDMTTFDGEILKEIETEVIGYGG